ncbi:hypothetical protein FHX37_1002 [Haloactinospora alba]|uniref:ATPase family protein associated with various cellular activities (AAA) n=1 Tax=Haloactinospora alba TaxID=405555 RepID=A0A543NH08_9ACTN|nr:hypothetical protein FHX37_1002 [Haloactinospora alba]
MGARSGGEADKLGNHYEGAWTVMHLLEVLAGRAESLTVEPLGDVGDGVEFILRRHNSVEAHQVKRKHGISGEWKLGDLRAKGVLEAARNHVEAGREFHFVSTIPAVSLDRLAERARHSPDVNTFIDTLSTDKLEKDFNYLSSKSVYGSSKVAWDVLRGIWVDTTSERNVRNFNSAYCGLLLSGAPAPAASVSLGDLIVENLATVLDYDAIVELLSDYELSLSGILGSLPLSRLIKERLVSWKANIERDQISPPIYRAETDQIATHIINERRSVFIVGAGGIGKSTVLHDVVEKTEADEWVVLPFRVDREEPFSSTYELGQRSGLSTSPVSALAAVARERPCLLVIDQLDAVSKISGRMPRMFDVVDDLVREAAAFPNMRVLLACRRFDFDNDDRIRSLVKIHDMARVEIAGLTEEQVVGSVASFGINASLLSKQQVALLSTPFNLKLLTIISDNGSLPSFVSAKDLLDSYWDTKRRDCQSGRSSTVHFSKVIRTLVDEMSQRQRLVASTAVLDDEDLIPDAGIMASEHVLVREGQEISFFHESFFDYAFARQWERRQQTLAEYLAQDEQELFRRTQVRQVLVYLREADQQRFIREVDSLLSSHRVRFHIQHVTMAVLRDLKDPVPAEWRMVERLLDQDLSFSDQLRWTLRTLPWFGLLDSEGVLEEWLRSGVPDIQRRAVEIMLGGAKDSPDRVAQLLSPYAGLAPEYGLWLQHVIRFINVHESRSFFELVVNAVRRGEYSNYENGLFLFVRDLADNEPEWAIDLLVAYLSARPGALALDDSGQMESLSSRDHGLIEMIETAATKSPAYFVESLLPYLLKIMEITEYENDRGVFIDRQFGFYRMEGRHHSVGSALFASTMNALRSFVAQDAEAARSAINQLASDRHDTAQRLLYMALGHSETYAEYAARLLLDRDNGFYATRDEWAVQELIKGIQQYISNDIFSRLESAVLELHPSWEGMPPGRYANILLSAMDESRLSEAGRRKLGEFRRRFGTVPTVRPPESFGGYISSPIPAESARRMNDDQWLGAMERYDSDREDWTSFTGGAHELAGVLEELVKADPERFARLSSRLSRGYDPSYACAILRGIGSSKVSIDPTLAFEAMRNINSLGGEEIGRWLGWPLRVYIKEEMPDDVIEIFVNRTLHGSDVSTGPEELPDDDLDQSLTTRAMNSARGHAIETLGRIVAADIDGQRTQVVAPVLSQLASDPSVVVRTSVALLISSCLRHAQDEAIAAFRLLIQSDDRMFAARYVFRLIMRVGYHESSVIVPVIQKMIASPYAEVRECGGKLAAWATAELGLEDLLIEVRQSQDVSARKGAAAACGDMLPYASDSSMIGEALREFFEDSEEEVRNGASNVAAALREKSLRPFRSELEALIESPAFKVAVTQLLITLDHAPDRVDGLILKCARRFVDVSGRDVSDISTHVAADARNVGELLMRAYSQVRDSRVVRSEILDLIDELLLFGAFDLNRLVDAFERQ